MNFPRSDSSTLHILLEPSDPWRVVQVPTSLLYWDCLGRARSSDCDLECVLTIRVDGSRPLPLDDTQSVVRGLGGHMGSALDEAFDWIIGSLCSFVQIIRIIIRLISQSYAEPWRSLPFLLSLIRPPVQEMTPASTRRMSEETRE